VFADFLTARARRARDANHLAGHARTLEAWQGAVKLEA
jgi:hypothetical protein